MLRLFKIVAGVMFVAMMLMLTLVWFWKNDAFELKAVKIQGNRFVSKEEIFEWAGIDFTGDIFAVNTRAIEQRILKHGMIRKVSVTRFLPSALVIKVTERDLLAVISGSEVSAVDVNGHIFDQFPAESIYDLPVITGFHFHIDSTGQRRPKQPELVQQAVNILTQVKTLDLIAYHELSDLHYSPDHGFIFYLRKNNIPVILGRDNYTQKLQYFLIIYHLLIERNELSHLRLIDLRFKDQVVVKNKI